MLEARAKKLGSSSALDAARSAAAISAAIRMLAAALGVRCAWLLSQRLQQSQHSQNRVAQTAQFPVQDSYADS